MSERGLQLTERDYQVIRLVYRFRFCLGRHIKTLAPFSGARATDRRIKALLEAGYLERTKYLYGVPYLYTVTHKGRMLIGANKRADTIRVERIHHDICLLDCAVFFVCRHGVTLGDIVTEKELHARDGFGTRRHYPDFVLLKNGKKIAVEIELTLKSKERIYKNGQDNFMAYDSQIWILQKDSGKLQNTIEQMKKEYPNIEILALEGVIEAVSEFYK